MLKFLKKWLGKTPDKKHREPMDMLRKTGSYRALKPSIAPAQPKPKPSKGAPTATPTGGKVDSVKDSIIEELGPGKNVLVRRRMIREDTGTHETLTILDDSVVDRNEESGLDPYNTGQFDRSKHWDKRFLK